MAIRPRTLDEILTALRNTRGDVDPYADALKGPISVLLYCYATGLSRVEQHAAYLSTVYQLERADLLAAEDLYSLGRNYGKDPTSGNPAKVNLTFWMQSRPREGKLYNVDVGTLAATADGRYMYATTRTSTMVGDSAELYYNADSLRYEISVPAEATAAGDDYNLPEGTISTMIGNVPDFDGVTNKKAAYNGLDPLTPIQFRNLIWNSLQGLNANLAGNIVSSIEEINPAGFDDVALVPSTNRELFKRTKFLNGKLGYDVYILSDVYEDDIYSGTSVGGEIEIGLPLRPVLSVEYVTVDGRAVPFSFIQDNTTVHSGSPLSSDKVRLTAPLLPAQVFEVRYYYYGLVYESWASIKGRSSPFGTDILVRRPNPVPILIGVQPSTSGILDRESVVTQLRRSTEAFLRNPTSPSDSRRMFYNILDPYDYQNYVLETVSGVSALTLNVFVRTDRGLMDIETITMNGETEYPILSPQSTFA